MPNEISKKAIREAFDAGRKQQQMDGNNWYPTPKEKDQVFNKWYNKSKRRKK